MPEIFDASKSKHEKKTKAHPPKFDSIAEFEYHLPDEGKTEEAGKGESKEKESHRSVEDYSEVMRHEEPSTNPFHAFAPKPVEVFFDSQEKSEQIILLLRKHPITQVKWIIIAAVLSFMPALFSSIGFFGVLPGRF